ncbi:hypothetical protein [Polynucleobacter sp. AP-Kolm-20A-A1]|uniref:hypothetical protein n=1 Tax=Polynucleobacter sp. AP-Kolm-20A-A1 TaxID=2081041 RepID=UPI00203CEB0B|nr:hypothetical protein [Polynucleobacter sp. AP-Kolm-20A-A1]
MSRVVLKVAALLAASLVLLACSPKLDWRTVQSPQERYSALFPGKPDKLERQIPYQGQEFLQTLEAVKIDDDIYSIGSIKLLANQTALLPNLINQLQSNLLDRAKASGGDVEILDTTYQLSSRQKLPSKDYFLVLKSSAKTSQSMRVRWITRAALNGEMWIYQISVLHPNGSANDAKTSLSKEEYENFFSGFSPE